MPGSTRGKPAAVRKRQGAAAKKAIRRTGRRRAGDRPNRAASLTNSTIIAFLATADSARARTFFESVVGLRLMADDPFALVFDANGIMLRIQKVDAVRPAAYTTLGWTVRDIAATIQRLGAKGVQFERFAGLQQDDLGVWLAPSGGRIAWFKDPDGHILSLTQF